MMTPTDLAPNTALFLDIDGTLLDIAPRHDLVVIPPDLPGLVERLRLLLGGALAVVSGRPLQDIAAFLPLPGLVAAAEHGVRLRLADGRVEEQAQGLTHRAAWLAALRVALPRWPGALIEEKSVGFVLHYRQAPEAGPEILDLLTRLVAEAPCEAEILTALMAYEVRPVGIGKGAAVNQLMTLPPFEGRIPVFIGDDVTDEEGMEAARALGGYGLHVLHDFDGGPPRVRQWLTVQAAVLERTAGGRA
jgi:trehalose 6-phosphate phosphatase